MANEKLWNTWIMIAVAIALFGILLMSTQDAESAEPPDVVVEQMHELVQKTCFDNPELDDSARDRCSLYVLQTLRNEYEAEQAAPPVAAAPPPPESVESIEPPPPPIIEGVVDAEGD